MNTQSLSAIKPKKLTNSKAYIYKDKIVLDFKTCEVILLEDTGMLNPCLSITHKELFDEELDKAISCVQCHTIHDDIKFREFTITSDMNSCFSAISGAGEDTYWLGSICTSDKDLAFNAYGLNYYFECYDYTESVLYVDYQVFYYLFQFTKHLSGKKTDIIFISNIIDDVFYIANSDKSIYIKCYLSGKELRYKSKSLNQIKQIYSIKEEGNGKQVTKKIAIEEYNTLYKNFSRAFGDIVYVINYEYFNLIYDDNTEIWFMKGLSNE